MIAAERKVSLDPGEQDRIAALERLTRAGGPELERRLREACLDRSWLVRRAACDALWGLLYIKPAAVYREVLDGAPSDREARIALTTLAFQPGEGDEQRVVAYTEDPRPAVARAALRALALWPIEAHALRFHRALLSRHAGLSRTATCILLQRCPTLALPVLPAMEASPLSFHRSHAQRLRRSLASRAPR